MARTLTQSDRKLTAKALGAYADQLATAETGNPVVDALLAEQRTTSADLSDLFDTATRASVSGPDEE